jgi:hypothetical protein
MKYMTLFVILFCVGPVRAQSDVPTIVTDGLVAYQKSGGEAAMAVWLKDSPIETDTTTRINVAGGLAQIATAYGKMVGYEVLRTVSIAPSLRRIFVLGKFEKGPVFFSFDCYKADKSWTLPLINFNTKPNTILPEGMLNGTN